MKHERPVLSALLAGLGVVVAFIACGDDDSGGTNPPVPSVRGSVTMVGTNAPVAGAGVILLDPGSLAARSRLAATDIHGKYEIAERVEAGDYALLLFADSTVVFDRSLPTLEIEDGRTTTYNVRMVDSELWSRHKPFIEGIVLNAATATPVAGAWVDQGLWAWQGVDVRGPLMGLTHPSMAITGADGRFSITSSLVTNEQGSVIGLFPISVAASGFEPTTLVGRGEDLLDFGPLLPLPDPGGDSILTVTIRLHPLGTGGVGPNGAGSISGRVRLGAAGIPGVKVAASLVRSAHPDTFPAGRQLAPIPDKIATTDTEGRFTIAGLAPGAYAVEPAYAVDDGYVHDFAAVGAADTTVVVAAGQTVEAGDFHVSKALTPITPPHTSAVDPTSRTFAWTPMPAGPGYTLTEYRLWYSFKYVEHRQVEGLTTPTWTLPDGASFPPGTHVRWFAEAIGTVGESPEPVVIGQFEEAATFTVQ